MNASSPETSTMQLVIELVNQAESLAFSSEWNTTARTMRILLQRWKTLEQTETTWNPEWTTRFRAAQQTFMERRAEYFLHGNIRKGAGLITQLEEKQAAIVAMQTDLFAHYQALRQFASQLQASASTEQAASVQSFIQDEIHVLQQEIQKKEHELHRLERAVSSTSTRYYCTE